MLTRNEVILVKPETVYGVDSVPGVPDAVQVGNISFNPSENARFAERIVSSGNLATLPSIFGGSLASISFDVEMKGSGTVGLEPEFDDLLRGTGHIREFVNGVRYRPASTGHESLTIYYYKEQVRFRLVGCRGTMSISATAGQPITMSYQFTGRLVANDPTDQTLPTVNYSDVLPPTWVGLQNFSINSFLDTCLTEFTLDPQLSVSTPDNANTVDGYGETRITQRDTVGSFDPEMLQVSVQPFIQDYQQQNLKTLRLQIGAAGGNRFSIEVPRANYTEVPSGDRDGFRTVQISFKAAQSNVDDEYILQFD